MSEILQQSIFNKARSDKFVLTLVLPKCLRDKEKSLGNVRSEDFIKLDSLQFSVYGSVVPKNIIPQQDVRYAGGNVYVSGHSKPSYDPVTVNFTIDNRFNNYWVINKWINMMRDETTGIFVPKAEPKDVGVGLYSSDFILTAKDEFNKDVIQWIYKSAFPVSLGEITFSDRDSKEIETSFEFIFRSIETILLPI